MAGFGDRGRLDPVVTHADKWPGSLAFPAPRVAPFDLWRDKTYIDPVLPSYSPSVGSNKMQFKIPSTMIFDFRKGFLQFTVTTSGPGGGTTQWLSNNAWSVIKVLRILTPTLIEEIRNYNFVTNFASELGQDFGATAAFGPAWGSGALAQRQAWGAVATTYQIPVASPFLQGSIQPCKFYQEELLVEMELAPPQECMESNAAFTSQSYTLTNIRWFVDNIYSTVYERVVAGTIKRSGLNFSAKYYDYQQSAAQTGGAYNFSITQRSDSVDGYLLFMADQGYRTTITNLDKFLTWNKGNLTLAQMRYNGRFYPTQPIDLTGNAFTAYIELLKIVRGKWSGFGMITEAPLLTLATFNNNRFALFFDVNHLQEDQLISRKKTSGQNQDTTFQLTLSAAMAQPQIFDCYIILYRSIFLAPSGRFVIAQ